MFILNLTKFEWYFEIFESEWKYYSVVQKIDSCLIRLIFYRGSNFIFFQKFPIYLKKFTERINSIKFGEDIKVISQKIKGN